MNVDIGSAYTQKLINHSQFQVMPQLLVIA